MSEAVSVKGQVGNSSGYQRTMAKRHEQNNPRQERKKYTYEMMLDQPCKFHTPSLSKPANHSTRPCTWFQKGDRVDSPNKQLPPPPPPPLTGGNAQAVGADNRCENRQPRYQNQERREAV